MKKLWIWLVLLTTAAAVNAQQGRFPNSIANADCNALLSGMYELKPDDVKAFVRTEMADIKLIVGTGMIKEGPETEHLNVVMINHNDERLLFPTPQVKVGYEAQVAACFKQLPGDAAANENKLVIFTAKQGSVSSIAYFHFENGRVVGYVHPVVAGEDRKILLSTLDSELKFAADNHKTVIWLGDEVAIPVNDAALKANTVIYRRPANINKLIPLDIIPLDKKFEPATASVINAVPSTRQQLIAGGFPINRLEEWQAYKNEIELITKPKFGKTIATVSELQQEIVNGNQDVLLIVAHLRGSDLYLGDHKLTLDEIQAWGKRSATTTGNRTALLFICNAGNQRYTTGTLFWKKAVTPLANILLDNHYFDVVLAPDHTILRPETVNTLKKMLEGLSMLEIQQLYKGWLPYVYILKKQANHGKTT